LTQLRGTSTACYRRRELNLSSSLRAHLWRIRRTSCAQWRRLPCKLWLSFQRPGRLRHTKNSRKDAYTSLRWRPIPWAGPDLLWWDLSLCSTGEMLHHNQLCFHRKWVRIPGSQTLQGSRKMVRLLKTRQSVIQACTIHGLTGWCNCTGCSKREFAHHKTSHGLIKYNDPPLHIRKWTRRNS